MSETGRGPGIAPGKGKADRAARQQRINDRSYGRAVGIEQAAKAVEKTPARNKYQAQFRDTAVKNIRGLQ